MNILFISPNSPRESIGGVERYISNLTEYCKNLTDVKTVILLPSYRDNLSETNENETTYFNDSLGLSRDSSSKEISDKAHLFSKFVEEIIAKHNIDIIVAENFHIGLPPAYSLLLNMVANLHEIPLVLRLHSFAVTEIQIQLMSQLMWNKISCVSRSVAGDSFQKGANINILSTDYLGVDTNEFNDKISSKLLKEKLGLSDNSKIVLTASRILRGRKNILQEKGIINLIQSFSRISPRYPDLRLLIAVGKSPDNLKKEFGQALDMLFGYIRLHNIETKTIIKSFDLREMPEVYRGSDVFVLASENETFGQVFIEAMASKLPVIGTNVGGIPEIISDGTNGFLVSPNDSSILFQTIEKLLNDHSIKDKFVKAGIKTVEEKFTAKTQFSNFFRMLEKTASEALVK